MSCYCCFELIEFGEWVFREGGELCDLCSAGKKACCLGENDVGDDEGDEPPLTDRNGTPLETQNDIEADAREQAADQDEVGGL